MDRLVSNEELDNLATPDAAEVNFLLKHLKAISKESGTLDERNESRVEAVKFYRDMEIIRGRIVLALALLETIDGSLHFAADEPDYAKEIKAMYEELQRTDSSEELFMLREALINKGILSNSDRPPRLSAQAWNVSKLLKSPLDDGFGPSRP